MAQRDALKTSWVYSLRKEELVNYLLQCAQDPSGTVDEMRRRLAKFITTEHDDSLNQKILTWQKQHEININGSPGVSIPTSADKMELVKPPVVVEELPNIAKENTGDKTTLKASTREDRIAKIELVRKWGLKYDGGKEVLKFVDRLEELATMYEIDLSEVVPVMCELLKDRALVWFRNNHKQWQKWFQFKKDFLDFFLPQRYFQKLEEEISSRTQRPRESFKDYVLALQDLMYHSKLDEERKLEIIFRNSSPDYQWYIKRRDFNTLDDLLSLAAELESIPAAKPLGRNEHHRILQDKSPPTVDTGVEPTRLTWEDEKIKAIVLLSTRPSAAIIDTGATRSFIMPSIIQQLRPKPRYVPIDVEVALADGTHKRISQAVWVMVTFGSISRNHQFLIMKDATDEIILGLDFLRSFKTKIQCAGLLVSCEVDDKEKKRDDGTQNKVSQHPPRNFSPCCFSVGELKEDAYQVKINEFLKNELQKFDQIKGLSTAASHRIIMKDDRPIKIRYAQRNPAMQAIIDEEVNTLLARGCIEPSHSPYSFPITLVKKKNGSWRTCMDFRQLNARSVPDAYPLPRIDTILDRLRNAKFISSLDLKDGYWQIPMEEGSKKYTAFAVTGRGLYQWRVMPFGLHSAPATFQRALDTVIGPEMEPHAFAYLDDIIVIGKTFEEHLENLKEVFRRLRAANLRVNVDKCEFFKSETKYLGHVVTNEGIKTDPEKIAAIVKLPTPQDIKGVRQFLGITSWYRRFVPDFAKISQPLTQLLKKGKHWKWGQEQQEAFEALKDNLTKAPVLACPDFSRPFTLQTDASDCGLGAVLTQEIDNVEHVIAYASRHLNGAEKNYSVTEKECLAIVWGIRKMRPYLEGYEFRVMTDHLSLKWLNSIDNPTGRLARWALELQQYEFSISYRKGKQNVVADALSRQPVAGFNRVQARISSSCPWYDGKLKVVQKNPEQYADYTIVDHKLYRHFNRDVNDEDSTPWKLCVPTYQRQQVLTEAHDKVTGGHIGIRKTINKVASRYYWPGLARDVTRYVNQCESCQRYKTSQQQPAGKMLTRIPGEPWSLLCADFIGPLPRTPHGNTMLLVLFDNFSKWVELIPCRKATAAIVVKAIRERIVSRYGVPKVLITDNGAQFTSRIVKNYLEEIGVKQQFTAPYTPQENPTERANRTIKTMMAQFSGDRHNRWDDLLPEMMLAINTSTSESTGYSPAFLTQGRDPRLPHALYDEVTVGTGARYRGPEDRAEELKEIFKIVRRNLEIASQKQRHHYNLRRRNWTPEIGERVLVRHHPLSKAIDNFTAKMAPKFKGPYIVTKFLSPVIVQLRAVDSSEMRTAHISELKQCHFNNTLFSLIHCRYCNSVTGQYGENMEANQQKLNEAREKLRRNLPQKETTEVPSTSTRKTESNRRMTVVESPDQNEGQHPTIKAASIGEKERLDTDVINISDDDEEIPPPPPSIAYSTTETEGIVGTPPPPIWTDECSSIEDLDLDEADLNDPFILDFCRTFWGKSDTTIDNRAPSPPSPPSSSSSCLDWENENFHPPTPPKRRGFGSVDTRDSQYTYLGMQCYERILRARILIPTSTTQVPVADYPHQQEWQETPRCPDSPLCWSNNGTAPVTPGRGWLDLTSDGLSPVVSCQQQPEPSSPSPIPSPPSMNTPSLKPRPSAAQTPPQYPRWEQLPVEIQQEIAQRREQSRNGRMRFQMAIWGHPYRITISRDGTISITSI